MSVDESPNKRAMQALSLWAETLEARGERPPVRERLLAIADAALPWAPTSPGEQQWAAVVNHLLRQVELGVTPEAAVALLPDEFRPVTAGVDAPSTGAGPAAAPPTEPDGQVEPEIDLAAATLDALIAWRAERIDAGVEGVETIRDITFKSLLKYRRTEPEEIRKGLAGPASALADEIAAVMARVAGRSLPGAAAAGPREPVAPTAAPHAAEAAPPRGRHRGPTASIPIDTAAPATGAGSGDSPAPPSTPVEPEPPADSPSAFVAPATTLGTHRSSAAAPASPQLLYSHDDFCAYEFGDDELEARPVRVEQRAGEIRLTWPTMPVEPGELVVYRLVSADDSVPYKPEVGDLLFAASSTEYTDSRFLTSAVRTYQVWAHRGVDGGSARDNQPVKWAQGEAVSPVDDFELYEEDGRVIGQWMARNGTESVRVTRRPLDGSSGGPQEVSAGNRNLSGFVDADAPRGRRFLYRAESLVRVGDSQRLSPAVQKEILISVSLTPVNDLVATPHEKAFDISWTTPDAGQTVRVYRFPMPPPAGLDTEDREESALIPAGFAEANRVKDPVQAHGPDQSLVAGVRWPADWERVYLAPVTSFNGRVRVGPTTVLTRPLSAVEQPKLVERFHTQLITFGWPDGASNVQVHVSHENATVEQACSGNPFVDVAAGQYRRDGAVVLPRSLPPQGCKVFVVPSTFSRGEQLRGEAAVLTYPGLRRARYELIPLGTAPATPDGPPPPPSGLFRLALQSELDVPNPPPLVAVINDQRLPLHENDGARVSFVIGDQARPFGQLERFPKNQHPQPTPLLVDVRGQLGFLRIFPLAGQGAGDTGPRLALIDPPIGRLYYNPAPPQQRWQTPGADQHG